MLRVLSLSVLIALVGCVTINVYFPAAAAEEAADRFIQDVLGEEAANETTPDQAYIPRSQMSPLVVQLASGALTLLVADAHAQQADIDISTPAIQAIKQRMERRHQNQLASYYDAGAIGFGRDGFVQIRDRSAVGLAERREMERLVNEENEDRRAVYREIAEANNHPEWEEQSRATFARRWIANAKSGWYYQDESGGWAQK